MKEMSHLLVTLITWLLNSSWVIFMVGAAFPVAPMDVEALLVLAALSISTNLRGGFGGPDPDLQMTRTRCVAEVGLGLLILGYHVYKLTR